MGVREVELLVIDDHIDDAEKNRTKLRVVQWVYEKKDGGEGSAVNLEKRKYYKTEDGEWRMGKNSCKGLNKFDLKKYHEAIDEVQRVMDKPPAVEPEDKKPAKGYGDTETAASKHEVGKGKRPTPTDPDNLEEVPF